MSDEYGYLLRYFSTWEVVNTEYTTAIRWRVYDRKDRTYLPNTFAADERYKVDAMCTMMNSIEEETA